MTSKTYKPSQNLVKKKLRSLIGTDAVFILFIAFITSALILVFEYVLTKFGGFLFLISVAIILSYQFFHQRRLIESLSYELTNTGIIIRSGKKHKSIEIVSWDSIDTFQVHEDKLDKNWNMRSITIITNSDQHKGQTLEGLSISEVTEIERYIESKLYFLKSEPGQIQN